MSLTSPRLRTLATLVVVLATAAAVHAHEHHDEPAEWIEGNNFTNDEDIDTALKWHMGMQATVWGLVFPVGMVLGINRWHVPLQSIGAVLTLAANYLGHHHGGRSFHSTAHGHFASYLKWYLILQTAIGIFLKMHMLEGTSLRRTAVSVHGVIGKSFPVVAWIQMIFGGIAALGFCFGEHFGQCLAHFIMGSAFIGYAMIMLLMLRVGAGFLLRHKVSQELLDSSVIMVWGIVNTFTEHDFFRPSGHWSHKDMQHVSLGVLWWAGGALGIWMGRNGKRNVVPALIIAMTGYAMSAHGQALEFSTNIHKLFGFSLMAAGVTRIVEICFVLRDEPSPPVSPTTGPRAFQHLPPFLLVLSGLTFLSATEEQMSWIASSGMDTTTYANILFSTSFVIYLVAAAILELYERTRRDIQPSPSHEPPDLERGIGNGHAPWYGALVPSFVGVFPGVGRTLGNVGLSRDSRDTADGDHYEIVPLTASNASSELETIPENENDQDRDVEGPRDRRVLNGRRMVFDVGEYEDEDNGSDSFWDEREKGGHCEIK